MSDMAKEQKEFVFPQELAERINEMSSAGFFLVIFDAQGRCNIVSQFDNSIAASSCQQFLTNWTKGLNELLVQSEMQNILDSVNAKKRKKK